MFLEVKDLKAKIADKEILKGVNLSLEAGKVHALMGQNGSGKSTLAQVLMGHPMYEVTGGSVLFNEQNLLEMESTERSKAGLFLSFQYPSEVTGVNVSSYLRLIYNKSHNETISPVRFKKLLQPHLDLLEIKDDFLNRYLNEGFSGGEKKRMEMLQMLILEPKLAILDEVDSGLDIDAVKVVSKAVNYLIKEKNMTVLVITHYSRILHYIEPDKVHIMQNGVIIKTGDAHLSHELEEKGYAPFMPEASADLLAANN